MRFFPSSPSYFHLQVVHRQLLSFHASLKRAESLDEIISLHNSHLKKVETECLLQGDTTALHQAILSILDLTLRFRDALAVNVGGGGPTAAQETERRLLHRSRRERQARTTSSRMTPREATQASDSESDLEGEEELRHDPFSSLYYRIPTVSRDDRQRFGDIYEIQDELDKLVRFIHSEVEGLADSASSAASAFSVLAFALEDWGI